MRQLAMILLLIAALLWLPVGAKYEVVLRESPDSEGAILMTFARAVSNWDTVSTTSGFQGWNFPESEPCGPQMTVPWTGVTCSANNVTRLYAFFDYL